jgi:hypothetical protein
VRSRLLLVAPLPLLVGCPKPPRPAKVDPASVVAITLHTGSGQTSYCPHGGPPHLGARVATTDGKVLETWMPGAGIGGRLEVGAFEWTTSWGGIDGAARLTVPYDPIAALDRDVTVSVRLVDRPDLVATMTLAPSFGCGGVVGDAGAAGASGWRGADGHAGRDGSPGSAGRDSSEDRDPTDGTDGGDGGDGGHGGDGTDGGDGGPGPVVEVAVTQIEHDRHGTLIAVAVVTRSGTSWFLVDPEGARFAAVAEGGAGGSGGSGGAGGRGGHGGAGGDGGDGLRRNDGTTPPGGDGGRGGDGGNGGGGGDGGRGGNGGDGGELHVVVDARWPHLAQAIGLSTRGGAAGYGGSAGSSGGSGDGGRGGYAGSNGGSSGTAGTGGQAGRSGRSGPDGRAGRDGRPPQVRTGDVSAYFPELVEAGLWSR